MTLSWQPAGFPLSRCLGPRLFRVLFEVVRLRHLGKTVTVRKLANRIGCCQHNVHTALMSLRDKRLVAWDVDTPATIRPLVRIELERIVE